MWAAWRGTCSLVRFWRWMRLRPRWRRSMRALLRWILATWVTLASAPAWAAAPRVTRVGILPWVVGTAAGSATLLTLLARLMMLSSPTTDRLLLETMDKLLEETYTDMLGCSMSRSSIGLASAVAPSAVKQGGGVTNQLSSMQPLSGPDLLLPPLPPHSLPEPGDTDGVEEGVDSLICLGGVTGVAAPDRLLF